MFAPSTAFAGGFVNSPPKVTGVPVILAALLASVYNFPLLNLAHSVSIILFISSLDRSFPSFLMAFLIFSEKEALSVLASPVIVISSEVTLSDIFLPNAANPAPPATVTAAPATSFPTVSVAVLAAVSTASLPTVSVAVLAPFLAISVNTSNPNLLPMASVIAFLPINLAKISAKDLPILDCANIFIPYWSKNLNNLPPNLNKAPTPGIIINNLKGRDNNSNGSFNMSLNISNKLPPVFLAFSIVFPPRYLNPSAITSNALVDLSCNSSLCLFF